MKLKIFSALLFCTLLWMSNCSQQSSAQPQGAPALPGIDVLLTDQLDLIKNKNVGLITNPTGVTSSLQSTIDALHEHPEVHLEALFGPEHGVRGDISAGERVATFVDEKTGIPVFSLYGATKKPTPKMLEHVDVLLFDIQDVGIRPYTYIYTMAYAMQAAQENNIPILVLDRPNPLGGFLIEGPMLEEKYSSFIGLYPIPYLHGMTVGELALYFNSEFEINAELSIVPMKNWTRDMTFDETGLAWIPTSPHVPHATTPFFLAATGGFGELHVLNEGVGYTSPFEYVGAEWIRADEFSTVLNTFELPGVYFRPAHYKPYYGGKQGVQLHGVQIHITDFKKVLPIKTQVAILKTVHDLYPERILFNPARLDMFYKAMGTDFVEYAIKNRMSLDEIYAGCARGLDEFVKKRNAYLLYK
jgi:uncharacterized protein YbbC (DUF1343 family)